MKRLKWTLVLIMGFMKINASESTPIVQSGNDSAVAAIEVSCDSKYIFTGNSTGDIEVWDYKSGKKINVFNLHKRVITKIISLENNKEVISCSLLDDCKRWNIESGEVTNTFKIPEGKKLKSYEFSSKNMYAFLKVDRRFELWSFDKKKVLQNFKIKKSESFIKIKVLHKMNKVLALIKEKETNYSKFRIYDIATGQSEKDFARKKESNGLWKGFPILVVSPKENFVFVRVDGQERVIDLINRKIQTLIEERKISSLGDAVVENSVLFSSDETRILFNTASIVNQNNLKEVRVEGIILVISLKNAKKEDSFTIDSPVYSWVRVPNSSHILVGKANGFIELDIE